MQRKAINLKSLRRTLKRLSNPSLSNVHWTSTKWEEPRLRYPSIPFRGFTCLIENKLQYGHVEENGEVWLECDKIGTIQEIHD